MSEPMQLDLAHYENRHAVTSRIARVLWHVTWFLFFRPTPRGMMYGWRRFLLRLFGATIGAGVHVLPSCRVWQPWRLTMGDYSCLSEDVDCYSVDQVRIGAQAVISQGAFLCTASHDISSPIMDLTHAPIVVGAQAWVAARAFVGPGTTVGEGAVVGACAVVTRDVKPWAIVAGNPARPIGRRTIRDAIDGHTQSGDAMPSR